MDSFLSLKEVALSEMSRPLETHSSFQTPLTNSAFQNVSQQNDNYTPSFIPPLNSELFTATFLALFLVHAATGAKILLQRLPSYKALGHDRKQSLAALIAVILGKFILIGYSTPMLWGSWNIADTVSFRTAYIIHVCIYIFDMTYRKPSLSLWVHHVVGICTSSFDIYYHATYDPSHDLYYFRGIIIFFVFAVGLADLGADFAILNYYLFRGTSWLAGFVEMAAHWLVAMRAIQWSLYIHLALTHTPKNLWGIWGMFPIFAVFMREEFLEWEVISGLGVRLRSEMEKSGFDKSLEKVVVAEANKVEAKEPREVVFGGEALQPSLLVI